MEDAFQELTRGNVAEVKIVLASIVAALAVYQLALIAVGYGKVKLPVLEARPAALTHRAIGDAIVVIAVLVAAMCLSVYGFSEDGAHAVAGTALIAALAVKVFAVRFGGHVLGRVLPLIGLTVFVLFVVTWATSAGDFLADR